MNYYLDIKLSWNNKIDIIYVPTYNWVDNKLTFYWNITVQVCNIV